MKLVTNDNNTDALKVVIASKISGSQIEICRDSAENLLLKPPQSVPQLVLESGISLFSSNAAVKFIHFPSPEEISAVSYYLDLEAAVIQPLTSLFSSKVSDKIKESFEEVLVKLEQELSSKPYLSGKTISAADIAVWCTLYPLCTDLKTSNELFISKEFLKKWFKEVHGLPEIQDALKSYPVKEGLASLTNLTQSAKTSIVSLAENKLAKKVSSVSIDGSAKEPVIVISEEEKKAAVLSWEEKINRNLKPTAKEVLPVPGEKNVLVTSALPYVNNVPHLGNIIGCVLSGDVFARYCRMRGYNTLYICGTDEYGTATETKALEEGLTPQQICDKYFKIHDDVYKWFNIAFDHFGRTTTSYQTEVCQDIFTKVYNNGYIIADTVEQLFCEKCDRYLADRFVEGICPGCAYEDARGDQCDGCGHLMNAPELIAPRCKLCQLTPVLRQSKQFFLDLPKIEPILRDWIQKASLRWSHNAREISKAWLNDGLKPRCITRDLKWGIPVPLDGYQNKVFYVWFDAPIGYISITKLYTDQWKKWWMPEKNAPVKLYQFMAKDNVPFHSVLFPASLLATKENYILVDSIFATEYLNYEDGKFSKSRGVGVFGNDAQDTKIPADIWRFYLLYVRPESQDSSFSWVDLATKSNSELSNILGNFINRALVFCEKNYDSIVPKVTLLEEDYEFLAIINRELAEYISMLEKGKLREGIRHMLSIARLGNQFMQASQPWVLCKGTDEEQKRCDTVIGLGINMCCLISQLLHPYMPETSEVIRKQLNSPAELNFIDDKFRLLLPEGHQIGKPFPLFRKYDEEFIDKLKNKYSGHQKSKTPPAGGDVNEVAQPGNVLTNGDVTALEVAVAAQGDLIMKMKTSGKDESEWQPQVDVLLNLKKKLAEAQEEAKKFNLSLKEEENASQPTSSGNPREEQAQISDPTPTDNETTLQSVESHISIEKIEKEVQKQISDPTLTDNETTLQCIESDISIEKLEKEVQKQISDPTLSDNETTLQCIESDISIEKLEKEVQKQADKVRELKESGADKMQWLPEVDFLLDLKKQLADAKGEPLPAISGKKNKKK